jgi:hypothetical protein
MHSPTSSKTKPELEETARRRRGAGPNFDAMDKLLQGRTKQQLLDVARYVSKENNISRPDRICERHRDALIVWYFEKLSALIRSAHALSSQHPYHEILSLFSTGPLTTANTTSAMQISLPQPQLSRIQIQTDNHDDESAEQIDTTPEQVFEWDGMDGEQSWSY